MNDIYPSVAHSLPENGTVTPAEVSCPLAYMTRVLFIISHFLCWQFITLQRAFLLTAVLSCALLVYDYVVNLSKERKYFWSASGRSIFRLVFLASRCVLPLICSFFLLNSHEDMLPCFGLPLYALFGRVPAKRTALALSAKSGPWVIR